MGQPLFFDTHHRSVQWNSTDEGLGAIDGIQDPAHPGRSVLAAKLLANNRVFRIMSLDFRPQVTFGLLIRNCQRRSISLALHLKLSVPKKFEGDFSGFPRNSICQFQALLHDGFIL